MVENASIHAYIYIIHNAAAAAAAAAAADDDDYDACWSIVLTTNQFVSSRLHIHLSFWFQNEILLPGFWKQENQWNTSHRIMSS